MKTTKCLVSGKDIKMILDLGMHSFADTFVSYDLLDKSEPVYPLQIFMNPENGNIQVGCITNDYDRYNLYNYSYTSSNSNFAREHWQSYYNDIIKKFNPVDKMIIEIGSNDGYLIDMFKHSNRVLGVDSSKEMCEIAVSKGINCLNKLFNFNASNEIHSQYGKCDLVMANNVFNHSNDPVDFAKGVANILNDDGVFVFESPNWMDTVRSGRFDQIYHEHIIYFTIKLAYHLLKKAKLEIFDFEIVDYHGGSLRIYSKKSENVLMNKRVEKWIKFEEDLELFNFLAYSIWQKEIKNKRNAFLYNILKLKLDHPDSIMIGVGAAAKANTFLNYYRLDNSIIDFITDASQYKIGKFTPLTRIPIVSDDIFLKYENVYAIILSWNISDDLKNKLLSINPKITFITP